MKRKANANKISYGSPPLARDKYFYSFSETVDSGITPACAGQIYEPVPNYEYLWDHPRLRGTNALLTHTDKEVEGITPACAGQICLLFKEELQGWDHPRLRGTNPFTMSK